MRKFIYLISILSSLLMVSHAADLLPALSAELDNGMDTINDTFLVVVAPWTTQAGIISERIFFMLIGLDFAWMVIKSLMKNDFIDGVMRQVATKVILYGIGYYLVYDGDELLRNIFNFFIDASESAANDAMDAGAGGSRDINVGNFFDDAMATISALCNNFLQQENANGGMTGFVAWLGKVGVIIGMALLIAHIAATILVAYAEMYMTITATVVLFGFFVSDWTREIAQRSILHTIAMGFKLFATLLIGRLCITMVKEWIGIAANGTFMDMITIFAAMFVFALLLAKLPKMLGAIVAITSAFSPGDSIASALRGLGKGSVAETAAAVGVLGNAGLTAHKSGAKGFGGMVATTGKNFLGAYGTVLKAKATTGRNREMQDRKSIGGQASHALHQARIDLSRGRDKG